MIIARYLTREVLLTLLAVTLVLLLALLCQQSVRYLNYVAVGKIPTSILLQLISFEIPYLLALLLPLGLYLGILLAYGRLYAESEMAILQMCGFGNRRLMRVTLLIAVSLTSIVIALMLWVNPWISAKRQQVMASDEATLHLIQTLIPGRFQVSPDGRHVMYVEKISRDHARARNIFMAQEKKNSQSLQTGQNAWMLVSAGEGYQTSDADTQEQLFVTKDGYRYEGTPGQSDFRIIQYKKYTIRIPQTAVKNVHQENESLGTFELWKGYANPGRAAEFQWRFSIGISTFLLALLAVPLSAVRPRQSRYLILLPAILIYIVYINLLFIARRWVEQSSISIAYGMWWVHALLLLLLLCVLVFHMQHWRAN